MRFVRQTVLSFVLCSLVLVARHWLAGALPDLWLIREGMLQDLAAELPIGRQALVSSLAAMPLPSLMALPFLPLLRPSAYGLAYLYGLALLLGLAAVPLTVVLRRLGGGRLAAAGPFLLACLAALLGSTEWSDVLAVVPMLVLAMYFELQDRPELRALAGVFWALTFFAHGCGAILVSLRVLAMVASRVWRRASRETLAVHWIQGISMLYVFAVYCFLNWMIMGSPVYPFTHAAWPGSFDHRRDAKKALDVMLATKYSDCRPVVSGLWGYAVKPVILAGDGYHFIDFKAGKLPAGEMGSFVLVIPGAGNPLASLSDLTPADASSSTKDLMALPAVTREMWTFVRIEMNPETEYP